MLKALTSRVNALWKISTFANFKTRKMIADGIFISTLVYMIQLWGGSSQSLISCLQIIQNKAARAVTKLGMRTPVKVLLLQCGWLSVKQLFVYHSCLFVFKIRFHGKPGYFYKMFHQAPNVGESSISSRTRLTSSGGMRIDGSRVKNHLVIILIV